MEITTYYKCACANCGQVIEYLASQGGKVVECPKCKEESLLPEPDKLIMIETFGPPIPQFRDCPVCGTQRKFSVPSCEVCAAANKNKRLIRTSVIGVSVVVLLIMGGIAAHYLERAFARRARAAAGSAKTAAAPHPTGATIIMEQPRPRTPKSTNDLRLGKFFIEKRRGSDLTLAVGDIVNNSENTHGQLRVDLDVLDKTGAKIGSVSDYFTLLGPHQTWHYVATVTESNAMSLRFSGMKDGD